MPIPKPKDDETKKDFLDRCMASSLMNKEYPDEKQRYAVCNTQWKEKKDMKRETRVLKTELRIKRADEELPKIEGYAAVFNRDSEDMGFIERIAPGAFKKALKTSDVRALFNHDSNIILGRTSAGTLELKEDKKGLMMSVIPPDTQLVRDMVLSPIERGDITQQSFGFTVKSDEWKEIDGKTPIRTITEIGELFDVSPVTFPAYPDTAVALRSLDKQKEDLEQDETIRGKDEQANLDIDIALAEGLLNV